jgi:hypothetical protein
MGKAVVALQPTRSHCLVSVDGLFEEHLEHGYQDVFWWGCEAICYFLIFLGNRR